MIKKLNNCLNAEVGSILHRPRANAAVTRWQTPVSTNMRVMKTRVGASPAASSLIVIATGSNPGQASSATIVPPMKNTGARKDETSAGRLTSRRSGGFVSVTFSP